MREPANVSTVTLRVPRAAQSPVATADCSGERLTPMCGGAVRQMHGVYGVRGHRERETARRRAWGPDEMRKKASATSMILQAC